MKDVSLRSVRVDDKKYFAKWWRNHDLIALTSGFLEPISDEDVNIFFNDILNSTDYHYMILAENDVIGHVNLSKRENNWYETQIIIGDKYYWGRGYGTRAMKLLLDIANSKGIDKIFLEVRPDNIRAIKSYEKNNFKKIKLIKYPNDIILLETLRMEYKR